MPKDLLMGLFWESLGCKGKTVQQADGDERTLLGQNKGCFL